MKKPKIVVIGLSGQSIFLNVDHFHHIGETVKAKHVYFEPGGKGYNQAVAARRLGGEVYFISAIGDDDNGRLCEERLKSEGVIPFLCKKEDINTAFAIILTDNNGENQVTVYRGAAAMLSANDIKKYESVIGGADILLLQLEIPSEANQKAMEIAEKYGVDILLNPAPAEDFNFDMFGKNIIMTPNQFEARTIFKLNSFDDLSNIGVKIREKQIEKLIITLGSKGCMVYESNNIIVIPSLPVKAFDTTGAGDVFSGALAVAIASGKSFKDAAQFAVVASGLSVTKKYTLASMPSYNEVSLYMKKHL